MFNASEIIGFSNEYKKQFLKNCLRCKSLFVEELLKIFAIERYQKMCACYMLHVTCVTWVTACTCIYVSA